MKTEDLRKLKELLTAYEQEKCKKFNKVCYKKHATGITEYCPAFTAAYDDSGYVVGGDCAISWLTESINGEIEYLRGFSSGEQVQCKEQGD